MATTPTMATLDKPLRSALKSSSRASSPNPHESMRVPVPPSPSLNATSSLPPSPELSPADQTSAAAAIKLTRSSTDLESLSSGLKTSPSSGGVSFNVEERLHSKDVPPGGHVPPPANSPPLHSALNHHHNRSLSGASLGAKTKSYTPKVSFDTFENPLASMFSFTLQVKSEGYKRTRNTRVYLCAASPDESGQEALDWCLESLVLDGDELIVFRGVEEEVLEKDHDLVRNQARQLMKDLEAKSAEVDPSRKLSLVLEYIPGKITDSIDRLIALYRPDSLIVGTRGKRGLMGLNLSGIGSISKYCLSHSPVPVIVVRPERKLKKAVEKRKADPKRGTHFD